MEGRRSVRWESVPEEACQRLQDIVRPHIESFNFFCEEGLQMAVQALEEVEVVERERPGDASSPIKHVMKDTDSLSCLLSFLSPSSLSLSLVQHVFSSLFLLAHTHTHTL